MSKYVVYITYGVYVDTVNELDLSSDEGYDSLKREAVSKMWTHGQLEVGTNAEIDYEDVTEEFKEALNE
jgi:hypothetical protein